MCYKATLILFMLAGCIVGKAQIGTSSIGSVTLSLTSVGNAGTIGNSALPACTPQNFSCNTQASSTYIFIGNGNWTVAENWINHLIPPSTLTQGFEIIINPVGNAESVLNVPQKINTGSKLTIPAGKKLRVVDGMNIQ